MSITDIRGPLVDAGSGEDRAAFIQGLIDLYVFYGGHASAPLPGDKGNGAVHLSIPVPPGLRGFRLMALQEIAERLGTAVVKRDGTLYAERPFGPVVLEAHIRDDDYTSELIAAGRRNAAAACPVVAYVRCASEAAVDKLAVRWGVTPRWNPDELQYEAVQLDEAGKPAEVAWWCPLEDAPQASQTATATGSAA